MKDTMENLSHDEVPENIVKPDTPIFKSKGTIENGNRRV